MKNITDMPLHSFPQNEFFRMGKIEEMAEPVFTGSHRHSFFEILWFTDAREGETHWIDCENYEVYPNQIYILSPGQIHEMTTGTKKGYLLAFSPDFFHSALELSVELFVKPYYFTSVLPESTSATLEKIISLMNEEYEGAKRKKLLEVYFSAFFIQIQPLFKRKLNGCPDNMVSVLKLIEKHFVREKRVGYYAGKVSLSVRRLNEISASSIGLTVKQLIIERLVTEAKRLIYMQKLSFKEIAYKLGFNDPAYFSRIFKKKTGTTPEEFKKSILK